MNNIILNRTFYVYCIRMYIVNQKKSRHKTLFLKYFSDLPVYTKKKMKQLFEYYKIEQSWPQKNVRSPA